MLKCAEMSFLNVPCCLMEQFWLLVDTLKQPTAMRRVWPSIYKWGNCNLWKRSEGRGSFADKASNTPPDARKVALRRSSPTVLMFVGIARRRYCKLLAGFSCNKIAVLICYTDGTYHNSGISWPFSYGLKGSYICPCHRDIQEEQKYSSTHS